MSNQFWLESAQSGLVFDIRVPVDSGAPLQALTQKDEPNQYWATEAVPGEPGYFWLVSADQGLVLDIAVPVNSGSPLQALVKKNEPNQYWKYEPVPDQPGYFWIMSATQGLVVDIAQPVSSGSPLQALVQKNEPNQYWKTTPAPLAPGVESSNWTNLTWGPVGTGPASNAPTACSGGNECAYQLSLSISSDGSYTFSGYYQNRGDVFAITAPPQQFLATFTIFDVSGAGYAFGHHGGMVPSAKQPGSLVTWSETGSSEAIALNWDSIATKSDGRAYVWNSYDESLGYVVGTLVGDAASAFETVVSDTVQWISQNWSTIADVAVTVVGAAAAAEPHGAESAGVASPPAPAIGH